MTPYNLTDDDIIIINLWCQKVVSSDIEFTGGIQDYNLLKSIPVSINQSFAGEELYPTIYDKCAMMWFSLSKYHCFTDGNKRTALVTIFVFLQLNGYSMMVDNNDLYDTCINIASGKIQLDKIKIYLQKNITIHTAKTIKINDILDELSKKKSFISILTKLGM